MGLLSSFPKACVTLILPVHAIPDDIIQWITVKVYDYHPPIPSPDAEAPKQSFGDCAICMEPIVVHPDSQLGANNDTSSQLLPSTTAGLRKVYALAPCHHIFVSLLTVLCIEVWLTQLAAYTMLRAMAGYQGGVNFPSPGMSDILMSRIPEYLSSMQTPIASFIISRDFIDFPAPRNGCTISLARVIYCCPVLIAIYINNPLASVQENVLEEMITLVTPSCPPGRSYWIDNAKRSTSSSSDSSLNSLSSA